ncbi:hypothetical protein [Sphingomonas sp.]|uniref:hypothetical protein n=1 Tax=Sphingomonas sp. TaxID=28214 RepID=UPI0025E7AF98|nr:hypothetical protein [Sphingomonas sp.]
MQHLQTALDALIGVATDLVVNAAASSARGYTSVRETATNLRSEAALQQIVGPALYKFASGMSAEVERRATPRFKSILAHPRHGREQLIDELDDADTEINTAIHGVGSSPTAAAHFRVALAVVRVRAITMALGENAFAGPRATKGGGGPTPRRRAIRASDLGEDVARCVIAAIDAGPGWHAALEPLRMMETTGANRNGVATKILAFADMEDGHAILERIAASVRPHFPPPVQPASTDSPASDAVAQDVSKLIEIAKVDRVVATAAERRPAIDGMGRRPTALEIARRRKQENSER